MKLSDEPILGSDIEDFITSKSDFAFEMKVLNKLGSRGFNCEHGGSYDDPITGKSREFDIRAIRNTASLPTQKLLLAVECKNLRLTRPLLAHCVPISSNEQFHHLLVANTHAFSHRGVNLANLPGLEQKLEGSQSPNVRTEFIAKSLDNIAKRASGELVGGDSEAYSRYTQALQSCHELVARACAFPKGTYSMILPILVACI